MSGHQLGKLTRREFRQRMDQGSLKACIIPVAATEQHLEHLAMEHDWHSVQLIANHTAQQLSPNVIVAEGLMVGISEHHMNHKGSLSLRPGTFLAVLNDLIRSMHLAGFGNILVLNGHGGNIVPCQSNWDQFVREFKCNLQFLSYWDVLTQDDANLLTYDQRMPQDLPGHAQEFETALALACFPENVRQDALNDQADTSPGFATKEIGELMLERIVSRLTAHMKAMIAGQNVIPIPAFQP